MRLPTSLALPLQLSLFYLFHHLHLLEHLSRAHSLQVCPPQLVTILQNRPSFLFLTSVNICVPSVLSEGKYSIKAKLYLSSIPEIVTF